MYMKGDLWSDAEMRHLARMSETGEWNSAIAEWERRHGKHIDDIFLNPFHQRTRSHVSKKAKRMEVNGAARNSQLSSHRPRGGRRRMPRGEKRNSWLESYGASFYT